jgi:hypothetical protein
MNMNTTATGGSNVTQITAQHELEEMLMNISGTSTLFIHA